MFGTCCLNATLDEDVINLQAMVGYPDGTNIMHKIISALQSNCDDLGVTLANDFIADGVLEVLQKAEQTAFKDQMPQRL